MNRLKKITDTKKIAIVLNPGHRTQLIEWAFLNKELLRRHELIAAGAAADCLADVLHHPITKLTCPRYGGYRELGKMLSQDKIDLLLFFGNPAKTDAQFVDAGLLIHTAIDHDITMGCNEQTIAVLTEYLKTTTAVCSGKLNEEKLPGLRTNSLHPGIRPIAATA